METLYCFFNLITSADNRASLNVFSLLFRIVINHTACSSCDILTQTNLFYNGSSGISGSYYHNIGNLLFLAARVEFIAHITHKSIPKTNHDN